MLRLISFLIIAASLCVGLVCASTAYVPYLEDIEVAEAADAEGAIHLFSAMVHPETEVELHPADTAITAEVVQSLKDAEITRVRVKEFNLGQWREKLYFGLCVIGLFVGGLLMRWSGRGNAALELGTSMEHLPQESLTEAIDAIQELLEKQAMIQDEDLREKQIVDRIDTIQKGPLNDFVEARQFLVSNYGMSGYAQLMDRFALAERQINRAWSAAADHVLMESQMCLANGLEALKETREHFNQFSG